MDLEVTNEAKKRNRLHIIGKYELVTDVEAVTNSTYMPQTTD